MHNMIKWHGYVVFSSRSRGRIWLMKNGWSIARFAGVQHPFLIPFQIQQGKATAKIWVIVTPVVGTSTFNHLLERRHDTELEI